MNCIKIFVSPRGNDSFSGKYARPMKQDGPFRTLHRAAQEIRKIKDVLKEGEILVQLREGIHFIDHTVVIGLEESGDENLRVEIRAYGNEKPIISSGAEISGFRPVQNYSELPGLPDTAHGKLWEADIPEGMAAFKTLFEDGEILTRGTTKGFTSCIDALGRDGKADLRSRTVMYCEGEAPLNRWDNQDELELVVRPWALWTMNILPVKSVDIEKKTITTALEGTYFLTRERYDRFGKESAWIQNVTEGLDKPGTWIARYKERKLYVYPKGEHPGKITVPLLQEFIRIEGINDPSGNEDIPVKNVHIHGLRFTQGERDSYTEKDIGVQHDWELFDKGNMMVRFRGAENCSLDACEFYKSGSGGVRLDLYCKNITVRNSWFHELGGGGIALVGYGAGLKNVNYGNRIDNNKIEYVARSWWHNAGILITQSGKNMISHNDISNLPYNGISMTGVRPNFFKEEYRSAIEGGSLLNPVSSANVRDVNEDVNSMREIYPSIRWKETGSPQCIEYILPFMHARENLIEFNRIHRVMQYLGDGNGIYFSETGLFNIIRNNFIYDMEKAHGAAIRLDSRQKETLIENNAIYRCSEGISNTQNNLIINNIIADITGTGPDKSPSTGSDFLMHGRKDATGTIQRNIVIHTGGSDIKLSISGIDGAEKEEIKPYIDYNLYYNQASPNQGENYIKHLQHNGFDMHSLHEDPGFININQHDFRLKENSPARRIGFAEIDVSACGLTDEFPFH